MLGKVSIEADTAERINSGQPALVVPLDGSELADSALLVATQLDPGISHRSHST